MNLVYQKELELAPLIFDLDWLITYLERFESKIPTGCEEGKDIGEERPVPILREIDIENSFSSVAKDIVRRAALVELDSYLPKVDKLKNETGNNPSVKYRTWLNLPFKPLPESEFSHELCYTFCPDTISSWLESLRMLHSLACDKHNANIRKYNQPTNKRAGRPRKEEGSKDLLVIAALAEHHKYEPGGIVGNYVPAKVRELSENNPGLTTAAISRFLGKKFPERKYKGYVSICAMNTIGTHLAHWQDEDPMWDVKLREKETGRRREED